MTAVECAVSYRGLSGHRHHVLIFCQTGGTRQTATATKGEPLQSRRTTNCSILICRTRRRCSIAPARDCSSASCVVGSGAGVRQGWVKFRYSDPYPRRCACLDGYRSRLPYLSLSGIPNGYSLPIGPNWKSRASSCRVPTYGPGASTMKIEGAYPVSSKPRLKCARDLITKKS